MIERPSPVLAFLIASILLGLVFIVGTPPFRYPDEQAHFLRSYAIAHGDQVLVRANEPGIHAPTSLIEDFRYCESRVHRLRQAGLPYAPEEITSRLESRPDRDDSLRPIHLAPAVLLGNPIAYLPQAAAIRVAETAGGGLLVQLYTARLVVLLLSSVLAVWALRLLPFGRLPMALFGLLPMVAWLRGSISPDAYAIAGGMLIVAVALRIGGKLSKDKTLTRNEYVAFAVAATILAFSKFIYLAGVLVLLPWTAPLLRRWRETLVLGLASAPAVALGIAWTSYATAQFPHVRPDLPAELLDAEAKREWLTTSVLTVPNLISDTLVENLAVYAHQAMGVFGWLDVPFPTLPLGLLTAILGLSAFIGGVPQGATRLQGLTFVGVFGTQVVLVLVSILMLWTPIGMRVIEGVQGRYFLPLLPALLLGARFLFAPRPLHDSRGLQVALAITFVAIVFACALWYATVEFETSR